MDRPILFSAPMVRALLDGRKTQTRRIAKFVETQENGLWHVRNSGGGVLNASDDEVRSGGADYAPIATGDRLWVKETWRPIRCLSPWDIEVIYNADGEHRIIRDGEFGERDWTMPKAAKIGNVSPLFMPRWASRLTLTVTDARVQRLQDISEEDARAEGVQPIVDHGVGNQHLHRIAFDQLWERIHGAGATYANPWVAAYTFTVARQNIDAPTSEARAHV